MLPLPKLSQESPLRLGLWLGAAGFCGVASTLMIDIDRLIQLLPVEAKTDIKITPALMALSLVQPTVLLAIAVVVGLFASRRIGLHAPAFEAVARRESGWPRALRRAVVPGIAGGMVGGAAIVAVGSLMRPHLPAEVTAKIGAFMGLMPLPTRLLYGGITEEVLLRWGFMSALAWASWRIAAKELSAPPPWCFVAAILGSALVFGAGHLPVAYLLVPKPTPTLIGFVVVANSAFGLVAGWLFWRRGLETAMVAHVITHLVLWSASRLGAYF